MKFYSGLFLLSFLLPFTTKSFSQPVFINEAMSLNASTVSDEDNEYSNWIELYNATDEPVDLQGFGLSDDKDNPLKWIFPEYDFIP